MLRYLSAGESHGIGLCAIIEGLPSNMPIDLKSINEVLAERQRGSGRGERMQIEKDSVRVLSGMRGGYTLGSPLCLYIENKDWENWKDAMVAETVAAIDEPIKRPRPGHADLAGAIKYNHRDIRNVLERASARETAIRTAVGAVALQLLQQFDIGIEKKVISIGGIRLGDDASESSAKGIIKGAREDGDTLGGVLEITATGLPPGLGSYVHYDRRLDGKLARALMSIQGIKGIEIGMGFKVADLRGSQVHDGIFYNGDVGYYRKTNNAGGLEGGVTNGSPLVLRCAFKPIPTLAKPLPSVDMETKEEVKAVYQRSDVCAIDAAAVVAKAAVAWEIAKELCEKFAGDSLDCMGANYKSYIEYIGTR